jgi:taurine dioxygenase
MNIVAPPTRLAPFGLEVELDLAGGLSAAVKDELRRAFAEDGLIVIHGRPLGLEALLDFCGIFGPVLREPGETFLVSNVEKDGVFGDADLLFHNDIPYVPAPYLAGALHALDVSGSAGATRFASGLRAYDALPQRLRARVDGLKTLQMRQRVRNRRNRLTDAMAGDNCAVQPLVGRQRGTNRPYLFAGQWHTACIIGMPEAESDKLLEELFGYFYAPDNIYDHPWKTGDTVLWDNLAVAHARYPAGAGHRTLQRVSIAEFSYREQYPADRVSADDLDQYRQLPAHDSKR